MLEHICGRIRRVTLGWENLVLVTCIESFIDMVKKAGLVVKHSTRRHAIFEGEDTN